MNMQQLRKAFAAWPFCGTANYEFLTLLKDPTPITEAGLRKLGLTGDDVCGWYLGERLILVAVDKNGGWVDCNGGSFAIKTLGQLRGLLLFVGE